MADHTFHRSRYHGSTTKNPCEGDRVCRSSSMDGTSMTSNGDVEDTTDSKDDTVSVDDEEVSDGVSVDRSCNNWKGDGTFVIFVTTCFAYIPTPQEYIPYKTIGQNATKYNRVDCDMNEGRLFCVPLLDGVEPAAGFFVLAIVVVYGCGRVFESVKAFDIGSFGT